MEPIVIYNKIDRLRIDKGWSKNFLCTQAGISSSTFDNWKTRETMPKFDIFEAICDALQVSIVQVLSDQDTSELPEEHKKVLELWTTLTKQQKELILNMMKSLRGGNNERI